MLFNCSLQHFDLLLQFLDFLIKISQLGPKILILLRQNFNPLPLFIGINLKLNLLLYSLIHLHLHFCNSQLGLTNLLPLPLDDNLAFLQVGANFGHLLLQSCNLFVFFGKLVRLLFCIKVELVEDLKLVLEQGNEVFVDCLVLHRFQETFGYPRL
jgi:hypothetical protein